MNKTAIKNYFFEEGRGIRIVDLPDWLDWSSGNQTEYKVALPMIQRGFVWKPNQIIELWDTLLRGMPIGSLMVSEVMGVSVGLIDKSLHENSDGNCLGLIDGQQRTLATLVGWPLPEGTPYSHRLWVDFADAPGSGQLVRFRVTTPNQPFGFQRSSPNTKLSLDDKRRTKELFHGGSKSDATAHKLSSEELKKQQKDYFDNGRPFVSSSHLALAIDMRELVRYWLDANGQKVEWRQKVMAEIGRSEQFSRTDKDVGAWEMKKVYANLKDEYKADIEHRIDMLGKGLEQLFAAEIPILRVQNILFESDNKDDEPPLAMLFKRIGSNATPLSNADYIYSILKHQMHKLHEMVHKLHEENNAASLLTPTDLVMSAFRLAAARTDGVADNDNPDKNAFHRLLPKVKSQLLNNDESQGVLKEIGGYFGIIQAALLYEPSSNPNGLPVHAFPHLCRPLVQVLLRLAQVGYLTQTLQVERRDEVLRLVLYWMQWVTDAPKASLIAFAEIKQWTLAVVGGDELGKQIYKEISRVNRGRELFSPVKIKEALILSNGKLSDPDRVLRGKSRFQVGDDVEDVDKIRAALTTYRHWWRPWSYRHHILLWLQREYVYAQEWPSPMAGNEEDTPYDYDHILPKAHWSGWTGMKEGARILEFCAKGEGDPHEQVGNAIGNVRVWDSSENRSDGADSPKIKSSGNSDKWLELSLIDGVEKDTEYWFGSPANDKERGIWDVKRTSGFQVAIEQRTFNLYKKLFDDANFASWQV